MAEMIKRKDIKKKARFPKSSRRYLWQVTDLSLRTKSNMTTWLPFCTFWTENSVDEVFIIEPPFDEAYSESVMLTETANTPIYAICKP